MKFLLPIQRKAACCLKNTTKLGCPLVLLILLAANACRQNQPSPPVAEKPDNQKVITETLRGLVEKEIGLPVSLKIQSFKESENHAFVTATMVQPDGSKMDFSKSRFQLPIDAFSDDVCALLKNENGAWKTLAIAVGPTDVPFICWWKEYGAPKSVFPEGAAEESCETHAPFVYVDNFGRIYVNASVGLTFEEFKPALVEALGRMAVVPEKIEAEFGEEVLMGTRGEVRTLIAEAIEMAKNSRKK